MAKVADGSSPLPLLLLLLFFAGVAVADTDTKDTSALRALANQWQNAPPTWGRTDDPCGTPWEGIMCNNSRVTVVRLSTMGIKGSLTGDLFLLTALESLDLSYNKNLQGPLPSSIGNLKQLRTLILIGCSFSGTIPAELGTLSQLYFLDLNSNQFTGKIPESLGNLSNLYWLDLADNKLSGTLPVSGPTTSGLDKLVNTKHFHFNKNQLSGVLPEAIFNPKMTLIHILFDANQFTGNIPNTVGSVKTLEVLRLDRNRLTGPVPSSISNLTKVNELNLANNRLTGPVPDLKGMSSLNYVDLSNNTFGVSEAPNWFFTLPLTTLVIESGGLTGEVPTELFKSSQLQQVILRSNKFNGTVDTSGEISQQLQLVDLQNNQISRITEGGSSKVTVILIGNPFCANQPGNSKYCSIQEQLSKPYSTSLTRCTSSTCPQGQSVTPFSCLCAYPYRGIMVFRAPFFSGLSNNSRFESLESDLWTKLQLTTGSVYIQNPFFNSDSYLQLELELFPSGSLYFNRSEIQRLGFSFGNQTYKPPHEFGPYFFLASPYPFPDEGKGKGTVSTGVVAGIVIGGAVLIIVLAVVGIYAFRQKRRAERATELSRPFASWSSGGKDSGGAPQLKGARWFSFEDLKKCTNNFSESNEIGSGGYGKVYRGTVSPTQLVAIKRAQQGSMQGDREFKTEIELLSRVHHKNLVSLVGFCFDKGEQMLVYEYIPNGTLRESLTGKSGILLDWKRRLRIALGSARGLAYLHELADPPIIHRDVKSSNILLDENLNAKVADFGLSKLMSDSEKGHVSTQVKGTLGYLDPEYYMTQQLTDKSDVYSFGVVMLELITAKQPIEKGKYIVREVRIAVNRNDEEHYGLRNLMDPTIRNTPYLVGFAKFVELALRCVEESAADRPVMNEVVKDIESILQQDGSNPTSASSSATDFGTGRGGPRHPYNDPLPNRARDVSSDGFDSAGYTFPIRVEPK